MNDGSAKQNIIDNIKKVDTILVTVSTNPSVDELSAALALTMFINDLDKHATAVVSGTLPPAIHFLEPEKVFEDSVDSLRDFVIALDKQKADHLRYKVEGDVVKIFITPYKTIITSDDLAYSQGDYNVEMAIALGVKDKGRLDKALESHGRILHDAIVATIGLEPSELGTFDYTDAKASSLSDIVAGIIFSLSDSEHKVSEQVASALLTGIVAATDRFSNDHTTSQVMNTAAKLMAAGANQQLIAAKLREGSKMPMVDNQVSEKIEKTEADRKNRKKRSKKRGLSIDHGPNDSSSEPAITPPVAAPTGTTETSPAKPNTPSTGVTIADLEAARSQDNTAETTNEPAPLTPSTPNESEASAPTSPSAEELLDSALGAQASQPATEPPIDLAAELEAASAEATSQGEGQQAIEDTVAAATEQPLGAVETPAPSSDQPSFGGVLNATTEQAAEDKRRAEAADRNRTILSHDRPSQGFIENGLGSSPMNGAGAEQPTDMFDPLVEPVQTPEPSLPPLQPPVEPALTLADIDQQNRQAPAVTAPAFDAPFTPVPGLDAQPETASEQPNAASSALEAVQAAYEEAPINTPAPIVTPAMEAVQTTSFDPTGLSADLSGSIPTPPPPPPPEFDATQLPATPVGVPAPDFSQLPTPPTLPDLSQLGSVPQPTLPPDNLGEILPPAAAPVAPPSSDPGQFRIPGQ